VRKELEVGITSAMHVDVAAIHIQRRTNDFRDRGERLHRLGRIERFRSEIREPLHLESARERFARASLRMRQELCGHDAGDQERSQYQPIEWVREPERVVGRQKEEIE